MYTDAERQEVDRKFQANRMALFNLIHSALRMVQATNNGDVRALDVENLAGAAELCQNTGWGRLALSVTQGPDQSLRSIAKAQRQKAIQAVNRKYGQKQSVASARMLSERKRLAGVPTHSRKRPYGKERRTDDPKSPWEE